MQFVHEPAAALYAYLRSRPDFREELARLENRYVIVFDRHVGSPATCVDSSVGLDTVRVKGARG